MRFSKTLVMPDPPEREKMKRTSTQDGLRKLQGWVLLWGRDLLGWLKKGRVLILSL